jgi:UDP-N-acetyl-D-glucosamine dehydrogenase
VPHAEDLDLDPDQIVKWAGGPIAVVDCFGILDDEQIVRYFKLGCEVKGLGRGHMKRLKQQALQKNKAEEPAATTVHSTGKSFWFRRGYSMRSGG